MRSRVVPSTIGELLRHLQQIQSAVVVSVAALRRQNCELDTDVSTVLQRCVADRIQDQIERLEQLERLEGGGARSAPARRTRNELSVRLRRTTSKAEPASARLPAARASSASRRKRRPPVARSA